MNQVAKVFVVVNFILSALYLGFAATVLSQQWDYRQMYVEQKILAQQQLKEDDEKLKDLEARLLNFRALVTDREKAAREKYLENERIKKDNEELKRQNQSFHTLLDKVSTDVKEINNKLGEKEARITKLEEERDRQKEIADKYLRDKESAEDERNRMEIQLSNLQGELSEKEKLLQRSQKELLEAKQIVRAVRDAGVNIPALFKRAEPVDGQVVAVSSDPQVPLVMISVGRDRKVETGYQFTVYRGSQYIGRVTVETVYPDMSAARIIKEMTPRAIQRGDSVTTRIGGGGSF